MEYRNVNQTSESSSMHSAYESTSECSGVMHVVKRGDTLYTLSKRYGIDLSDLMNANPNVDVYNLQINSKICIPNTRKSSEKVTVGKNSDHGYQQSVSETVPYENIKMPKVKDESRVEKFRNVAPVQREEVKSVVPETRVEKRPVIQVEPKVEIRYEKQYVEKECPSCPKPQPCPTCPVCPEQQSCPSCPEQQPCETKVEYVYIKESQPVSLEEQYEQRSYPYYNYNRKPMGEEKVGMVEETVMENEEKFDCDTDSCYCDVDQRYSYDSLYRYENPKNCTKKGCYQGKITMKDDEDDGYYANDQARVAYGNNYMYFGYANQSKNDQVMYQKRTSHPVLMAHVVMNNESLGDICRQYNMSVNDIMQCNQVREIRLCPGKSIMVYRPDYRR